MNKPVKQHLIDPEICIRCNTCEETCPIDAVTHNDDNYVVLAEKCNFCMSCIAPCPTGAIDNWRVVLEAYPIDEQFEWFELPEQEEISGAAEAAESDDAVEDDVARLLHEAHEGAGGKVHPPASASAPSINLYNRKHPLTAVVQGNYRLTAPDAESDIRHIILSAGNHNFPVLEGQSVGVIPPGTDRIGNPHAPRLYSISSARDGERPNTNNFSLTVKREPEGVCSNYLCDLKKGDTVELTGPFGATFLMPNDTDADIVMICTGTGSAPFRAFTERRRRAAPNANGKLHLFFGARRPEELPYFGPLKKVPTKLLVQNLVFSRLPDRPKEYVQDRMRVEGTTLSELLKKATTHIYVCGLKGMETGVDEALDEISREAGLSWDAIKSEMRESGRYHVETY
ncbi:benzoyl-CoA 2,3-epoxidase subunit BoxA [Rhodobium gokarnense]|uniref:Benzoyl-CoA 2,3-dioxygenase component A n=1 Tax=Rhodobium gokarnense TaxID=364296 RepID=A0ABT3HBV5_9HYPH|nr:benzoyl-CoA 2,3-epoxidase subunit BoxA [Rhodobium gokarnense]MCW2307834.1 benzoyl-CoA 2,3-dioxygenase component A [Rhodobium gokarnense]